MLNFRPVVCINGILLVILAVAMAVPLAVDLGAEGSEWRAFLVSAGLSGFVGLALVFAGRGRGRQSLGLREAFLLTSTSWAAAALFAALPLALGSLRLDPVDALFEAVSGVTTTGATVLVGLDDMPRAVLLWRALLEWLGGLGIIATAITLLPILNVGGMQLFRLEGAERQGPLASPLARTGLRVMAAYLVFTLLLVIGFNLAGMSPFEAICHAMTTLSTGGFSTSDQSLGHFSDAARLVAIPGMLVGGMTFAHFTGLKRLDRWVILKDSQFRWYLAVIVFFVLLLSAWNWSHWRGPAGEAVLQSAFNVVSILTTSGFHSADYESWGGFAQLAFFIMAFVGGCTGSTAGGIKIFRFEILFANLGQQIRRLLHPHGLFPISLNGAAIEDSVLRSVLGFMMLYFLSFGGLAIALALSGLDVETSLSAAAAALGNVGPALGPLAGPSGSYHELSGLAKLLLAAGMFLGRLEVATVLVLFTRDFWEG